MLITVYPDTRSNGRCTKCRHNVEWVSTIDGRRLRFNTGAVALKTGRDAETWKPTEDLDSGDLHTCRLS